MKRSVLYSEANYAAMVRDHGYFVDKTSYIAELEKVRNPVFLRPRRFGKSLFCSILWHYYDINNVDRFDELFSHTWIGKNPTEQHNQYFVLFLNFSNIATGPTLQDIEESFKDKCNHVLNTLRAEYSDWLGVFPPLDMTKPVANNLSTLLDDIRGYKLPQLYVIIDEYDNFANQLITSYQDELYAKLTEDGSFLKTFFKTLKEGRELGAIANVFITGVLPIVIDELASAFNIATFITLVPKFEGMLGFTQSEVDQLVDAIYTEHDLDPETRPQVDELIKNHYDGYRFLVREGEPLYNSTILMYFLNYFYEYKEIPSRLMDANLKTDLSWVRRLTASNPELTREFVEQLTLTDKIDYDEKRLIEKFNMSQFFDREFFPISFFYLGLLTRHDYFQLRLPNLTLREIFVDYFNEIHQIKKSDNYTPIMQQFLNRPDLESLFAGYWSEYISQLPEAIFTKVNENFYRTTFYELCSRYLSRWFIWNVERSYASGKSDLEFVGKYHEQFAGLRWVVEFKYYSNTDFKKLKTSIEDFKVRSEDKNQVIGYAQDLRKQYPQAQISQFVIYCFGNQGFRVFEV